MIYKNIDTPDHDEPWLEAVRVFRSGDKAGALFLFKRLAQEGCAPALVEIGNIYEQGGQGVEQNFLESEKWYLRSVEVLDDPNAHLALGRLYLKLDESESNYRKAKFHFEILESYNSHMGALYGLGLIYEFGLGVPRNNQEAENYYRKSLNSGHVLAMRNLARLRMKVSFFEGSVLWFRASYHILRIFLINSNDPRIGIH